MVIRLPAACTLSHGTIHLTMKGLSYAWGDPHAKQRVICDGKKLNIGQNLHSALLHLRYPDKPRLLWVDCLW